MLRKPQRDTLWGIAPIVTHDTLWWLTIKWVEKKQKIIRQSFEMRWLMAIIRGQSYLERNFCNYSFIVKRWSMELIKPNCKLKPWLAVTTVFCVLYYPVPVVVDACENWQRIIVMISSVAHFRVWLFEGVQLTWFYWLTHVHRLQIDHCCNAWGSGIISWVHHLILDYQRTAKVPISTVLTISKYSN